MGSPSLRPTTATAMWIALAFLSACGSAGANLVLKRAVAQGGVVASAVAFRGAAALLLIAGVAIAGIVPAPTPAYWPTAALVLPPEVGGLFLMSYALRHGELSQVQPIFGLLPVMVMGAGMVVLHERPTLIGASGVLLVGIGVYTVGLRPGHSVLEPVRALARSRASWCALGATACWSVTTLIHKFGIAAIGPYYWGITLTLGSSVLLALTLPFVAWRSGSVGMPSVPRPWLALVVVAGGFFALQQLGLQLALRIGQAGYVSAVIATSTVMAAILGVMLLRERHGAAARVAGAVLVTIGASLVAIAG